MPNPRFRTPLLASALCYLGLVAAFWITAAAADGFVDSPFIYTSPNEWAQSLVRSTARFPGLEESGLHLAAITLLLPAVVLLARALARSRRLAERGWISAEQMGGRLAAAGAVAAVLLCFACRWLVTHGVQFLDDERAHQFEAELFAAGRIHLPPPPPGLGNPMLLTSPVWASKYPPGQALVLLPGAWLGHIGLMPPLVVGVTVIGAYLFGKNEYGARSGLLAAIWIALSPFFIANGATLLPFSTMACVSIWCLAALSEGYRTRQLRWHVVAGGCLGLAAITRPYDAIALTVPLAAMFLHRLADAPDRRRSWVESACFLAGTLPPAALFLGFNWRLLGSPFALGYLQKGDYNFGFWVRPIPGFDYVHTPTQAIGNAAVGLWRLDLWLIGWPGSLLLAWLGLFSARRGHLDRVVRAVVVLFLLLYLVPASSGTWDVGPTYYLAVSPLVVLLATRGLEVAGELGGDTVIWRRWLRWTCVVGGVTSWWALAPLRVLRLSALSDEIAAPWQAIRESGVGDAIVVLPSARAMAAAGYALGYPYEVETGPVTVAKLCRPGKQADLAGLRRFLGVDRPVYLLQLDRPTFAKLGSRRYDLVRLER
jgi:hypothetical protein